MRVFPVGLTSFSYCQCAEPVFWPVLVIATLAAIVGSQAVISATFSIIKQCVSLYCFPRVKVIHTSKEIHGQIYIPEINWILFLLCVALTIGFRNTITIGNAYGMYLLSRIQPNICLEQLFRCKDQYYLVGHLRKPLSNKLNQVTGLEWKNFFELSWVSEESEWQLGARFHCIITL